VVVEAAVCAHNMEAGRIVFGTRWQQGMFRAITILMAVIR
jgi:hypothetical protein